MISMSDQHIALGKAVSWKEEETKMILVAQLARGRNFPSISKERSFPMNMFWIHLWGQSIHTLCSLGKHRDAWKHRRNQCLWKISRKPCWKHSTVHLQSLPPQIAVSPFLPFPPSSQQVAFPERLNPFGSGNCHSSGDGIQFLLLLFDSCHHGLVKNHTSQADCQLAQHELL